MDEEEIEAEREANRVAAAARMKEIAAKAERAKALVLARNAAAAKAGTLSDTC
jgi:hypothetical protein